LSAFAALRSAGLVDRVSSHFLGLSEPARPGATYGLRAVLESYRVPCLDHSPEIGGRFSALTNVGLLPAMARGLDPYKLRAGAKAVTDALLAADGAADHASAVGAAVAVGLAKEQGVNIQYLMPYTDRLSRFAHWFSQLWAESLGKDGKGTTPVAALGPVDQHSQLQMLLDGPRQHLVTLVRTRCGGTGPVIEPDLARLAGADYLSGRKAGDLVYAQQQAIAEALRSERRPVRTLDMDVLDESALGGLMMHFMIETIFAGRLLGVDPFGQPAVELCKRLSRERLKG
ncbi:MAG: glucose-6-phosphate isomerase, partial [Hyphomicrobiales bacterium]